MALLCRVRRKEGKGQTFLNNNNNNTFHMYIVIDDFRGLLRKAYLILFTSVMKYCLYFKGSVL